jgi:hypothetical protein
MIGTQFLPGGFRHTLAKGGDGVTVVDQCAGAHVALDFEVFEELFNEEVAHVCIALILGA